LSNFPFYWDGTRRVSVADYNDIIEQLTGSQIKSGSFEITGNITQRSGSNLTLQSGSIIPFALPASYIFFTGSIINLPGPYYALDGSTNKIVANGSIFSTVFNNVLALIPAPELGTNSSAILSGGNNTFLIDSKINITKAGLVFRDFSFYWNNTPPNNLIHVETDYGAMENVRFIPGNDAVGNPTGAMLDIASGVDWTLDRCLFIGAGTPDGTGIRHTGSGQDWLFNQCQIYNLNTGMRMDFKAQIFNCQMEGNFTSNLDANGDEILIVGGRYNSSGTGIRIGIQTGFTADDVKIIGAELKSNTAAGINLTRGRRLILDGCQFNSSNCSLTSGSAMVVGNTFDSTSTITLGANLSGSTITGNHILGTITDNSSPSNNIWGRNSGTLSASRRFTIAATGSGNPTTAEISSNQAIIWKNVTTGTVHWYYNDAGTLKSGSLT